METPKSAEQRKLIDGQLQTIKAYVDGFELFLPKDETALAEIADVITKVAGVVKDMDESRLRRRQLVAELDRAFSDLESSQRQFADKVRTEPR